MIREHFIAVKQMIPQTPRFAVHLGSVRGAFVGGREQDLEYPYVVLWGDPGNETGEDLAATLDTLELRIRVTYAARGFEQLLDVVDLVRDALTGRRPPIEGYTTSRLEQRSLQAAQADKDVTLSDRSHPMFATDEFVLTSQRI